MSKAARLTKNGEFSPPTIEGYLLLILGIFIIWLELPHGFVYHELPLAGKIIILIFYLGFLVGIAPIPIPVFRNKFKQVVFFSFSSGLLDSYIVLDFARQLETQEQGIATDQKTEIDQQEIVGNRAKLMSLITIGALIGGLTLWFGEVYAAALYSHDGRTGPWSALYIVPPIVLFVTVLGLHAQLLKIDIVGSRPKYDGHLYRCSRRNILEFGVGIFFLLFTHNPLLMLGGLLIYAVTTDQYRHLLDVLRHHTEVNVIIVLFTALVVEILLDKYGVDLNTMVSGYVLPIFPSALQAVIWGTLYIDPGVHFWVRLTNLSTGALFLPISSLVGIMIFQTWSQWKIYMRYSICYAVLWYGMMHAWIYLTLHSPIGTFLEQWARPVLSHSH